MRLKTEEKLRAIELRRKGCSVNEIYSQLGVAKSTVSLWVRNIPLSPVAEKRLLTKIKEGQWRSAKNKHQRVLERIEGYLKESRQEIMRVPLDVFNKRLICALLYWCEGIKNHYNGVAFVNSDPNLVRVFLGLFREIFDIDEKKLRVCIHLHTYHDPGKQMRFWSKVAGIPLSQFTKPYQKANTGKRVRNEYAGCVAIRYHNNDVARQLLSIAKAFLEVY